MLRNEGPREIEYNEVATPAKQYLLLPNLLLRLRISTVKPGSFGSHPLPGQLIRRPKSQNSGFGGLGGS